MNAPSPIARRFYRAFYQWTLLCEPTSARSLPARRNDFHSSVRRHDGPGESRDVERPVIRKHPVNVEDPVIRKYAVDKFSREVLSKEFTHRENQSETQSVPKRWLDGPIEDPARRPFAMLTSGEYAIRHRSESDIMLELAVGEEVVFNMRKSYGDNLDAFADGHGVKLELQLLRRKLHATLPDSPANALCSVIVSGPFRQVHKVHQVFQSMGNRRGSSTSGTRASSTLADSMGAIQPPGAVAEQDQHGMWTRSEEVVSTSRSKVYFYDTFEQDSSPNGGSALWSFNMNLEGALAASVKEQVRTAKPGNLKALKEQTKCNILNHRKQQFRGRGSKSAVQLVVAILKEGIKKAANEMEANITVATSIGVSPDNESMQSTTGDPRSKPKIQSDMDPEELVQLGEDVRVMLRSLTHPVVLITSRNTDNESSSSREQALDDCRGITVSSFNTVTLHPQPIISFNIKTPSRTWDAIRSSQTLGVHLLYATSRGAAIADVFTKAYHNAGQGFHELKKMGVDVRTFDGIAPPRVFQKDGVLAQLRATVLTDRCVEISDHIIVVARVDSCKYLDESGPKSAAAMSNDFLQGMRALSYASKGYCSIGKRLRLGQRPGREPRSKEVPDEAVVKNQTGQGKGVDELARPSASQRQGNESKRTKSASTPKSPVTLDGPRRIGNPRDDRTLKEPINDPIYNVLRGTRDAVNQKTAVDIDRLWNEGAGEISKEVQQEEDEFDFGFDRPNHHNDRDQSTPAAGMPRPQNASKGSDNDGPLWGPDDLVREESGRLGTERRAQAAFNLGALDGARRSFSTFSNVTLREASAGRYFSTKSDLSQESKVAQRDLNTIAEPDAMQTTIADFLGVPDDNMPSRNHHVRGLIKMRRMSRIARSRLEAEKDQLSEEQALQLREEIRTNDRIVTRKLAWNAAGDLRLMLDKGRVDFKRAQFLESTIEQGQALLLDDAKHARELLQQGKIDTDQFKTIKSSLENDHATLVTETNRLRQFVDEEAENYRDDDD